MTTEVIIQHFPGEKYRVTGTGRFAVTAEGDTKAEALANFKERAAYFDVETIEIPVSRNGSHPKPDAPMGYNHPIIANSGWGAKYSEEFRAQRDTMIEAQRAEENARQVD